jgi:hypothetical protein
MMEAWHPCKVYIKVQKQKPRRAYAVLHDMSGALEPRAGVVLLIRHPNGTVIQVPGRVARRRSRGYAEIYIPIDAALTLAVWMDIRVEKSVTIYGYAAKIKEVKPPAP